MTDPKVIIDAVCERFDLTEADLKCRSHDPHIVEARHTAVKLLMDNYPGQTKHFESIGKYVNRGRYICYDIFKFSPISKVYYDLKQVLAEPDENTLADAFIFTSI